MFQFSKFLYIFAAVCFHTSICFAQLPSFWERKAKDELRRAQSIKDSNFHGKNVIFFVGDGLGMTTTTATRIYKGELNGFDGEQQLLSYETLDHVGLIKTYNTDRLVPDSSGTATAFFTGVKTKSGVVGLDDRVIVKNCSSAKPEIYLKSFLRIAAEEGRSVGLVTTTRVTHATPASAYANSPSRYWEADVNIPSPKDIRTCPDIARQMVDKAIDFRVIFGGGRRSFMLKNQTDPENNSKKGKRNDEDLIKVWKRRQSSKQRDFKYITKGDDLRKLDANSADYLLGLFANSHLDYEYDRRTTNSKQPSLKEMTSKALEILQRNTVGYVLVVEGGRIDHSHHGAKTKKALYETLAMEEAVQVVLAKVDLKDTLVMSTSDHSHVFTFGGYHRKGSPILGPSENDYGGNGIGIAKDDKPYTDLLYANGPGATITVRQNITGVDTQSAEYELQGGVPLTSETHGGEDVAVYAGGPMSHLIHGVHEQSYLTHVIMYSACLGPYKNEKGCPISSATHLLSSHLMTLISLAICIKIRKFL